MAPSFEIRLSELEKAITRIDTSLKWMTVIGGAVIAGGALATVTLFGQNFLLARDVRSVEAGIERKLDAIISSQERRDSEIADAIRSLRDAIAPPPESGATK